MDYLRQGIYLRGYAQKQPKQEFKREAFELFQADARSASSTKSSSCSRACASAAKTKCRRSEQQQQRQAQARQLMQFQHAEAGGLAAGDGGRSAAQPPAAGPCRRRCIATHRRSAATIRVHAVRARSTSTATAQIGLIGASAANRIRRSPPMCAAASVRVSRAVVHVVAGVCQRRARTHPRRATTAGKHLAGFWEFPGGKSDPGEAPFDALRRELAEEIGIEVHSAEPLIAVPWSYPEKRIVLDAWIVSAYAGVAHAREEQPLRWVDIDELAHLPMPAADRADHPRVAAAGSIPHHAVARFRLAGAFTGWYRARLLGGHTPDPAASSRMVARGDRGGSLRKHARSARGTARNCC